MIIKLYRYYGVLDHEKTPVYADHYVKDYSTCHDEILVEFPDFTSPNHPDDNLPWWKNTHDEWCFMYFHAYSVNECVVDHNGVPALRLDAPVGLYEVPCHFTYCDGKILSVKEC